MSWPISGRSAQLGRRAPRGRRRRRRSPASPSLAAQRPPPIATAIGPSARSATASPPRPRPRSSPRPCGPGTTSSHSSSRRWITARSSNSLAASRSFERSGVERSSSVIVDRDLDVFDHRRELLRDAGVVGVLGQVLLALRSRDLVDRREHLLERAELLQQLGGGLVADPGDAGDVVGGVALEADEVGDQLRRDPVALDHPLVVVDLGVGDPARGRHHPDPVADELVDVAVAGDDHHRDLGLGRLCGPASRSRRRPHSPRPRRS